MKKSAVFIDTNTFGNPKNYDFQNKALITLFKALNKETNIDVYIPSIVEKEIKKHIRQHLEADFGNEKSKYFKDNVKKNMCNKIIEKLYKEFDDLVNSYNIKILDCEKYVNIYDVNDWYFNEKLPFESTKPEEFPDAMIISSIINYLKTIDYGKVYILSSDKGFRGGVKEKTNYNTYKTIGSMMRDILNYDESTIRCIKEYIKEKQVLYDSGYLSLYGTDSGDLIDVSIDNVIINDIDIVDVEDDRFDIIANCNFRVSGEISVVDPYSSIYDREESAYYYTVIKGTDKLNLNNIEMFVSLYKDKEGNFYKHELSPSKEIDITKYLDQMEYYSSY